jgi:hypothetical protein
MHYLGLEVHHLARSVSQSHSRILESVIVKARALGPVLKWRHPFTRGVNHYVFGFSSILGQSPTLVFNKLAAARKFVYM